MGKGGGGGNFLGGLRGSGWTFPWGLEVRFEGVGSSRWCWDCSLRVGGLGL